jgi:3-hydroxyisobutyrate dehydrogenase
VGVVATVAWVGLGHMGVPMTANLVRAGHVVRGYDLVPAAVQAAAAEGVVPASSVAEAATGADFLVTMLQTGDQVSAVLAEALPVLPPTAVVVDSSTVAIDDARRMHETVSAAGFPSLDAPVSGGVPAAIAGTLTFMVGGDTETLTRARPIIDVLAGRVFHMGGPGAGSAAKIANNLMLGITLAATCEGAVLADRLGLDHRLFYEMAKVSSGDSWALRTWYPMPGVVDTAGVNRDFEGGFATNLMSKDIGLALNAAASLGLSLDFAEHVGRRLQELRDAGMGNKDSSVFVKLVDGSLGPPPE